MQKIFYCVAAATLLAMCLSCNIKKNYEGGKYQGEEKNGLPSGYGTLIQKHTTYNGFWENGKMNGYGTLINGKKRYVGEFKNGYFSGYGELTYGDSVAYSGQWKNGKRQGKGLCKDSMGRHICGLWKADMLVWGTRTDLNGTYIGQLNNKGIAEGHGRYISNEGREYEGLWKDDRREGFGFSIVAHHQLKAGEWENDKYRGEKVVYTSERIYGIDVSKYQHVIGRHKYPIYWNHVRISNLGNISKKRVNGNVDYKISFVYIKSTEGTTMRNKYYASDYRQARANGIYIGSYHFFSTLTNPAVQAKFFIRNSHFNKGDFPPVLDVEPMPSQIRKMGGTGVMFNHIRTWMNIVQQRTGVRPILYVSQTFVNRYLSLAPDIKKNYDVWIARYGEYKPDVRLVYWQLCPDGRVKGIHGEVDINVFNGYRSQYDEFINNQTIR